LRPRWRIEQASNKQPLTQSSVCTPSDVLRYLSLLEQHVSAVQIPDDLGRVIDRQVAKGHAASAAEFVEAAVRRYALELEADDAEKVAAANEGIEAIRRGDYITISSPEDQDAFRQRFWSRAVALADEMRAHASSGNDEDQAEVHTTG
jgi:Arc/MetJ-type ribon-helix-helix transcriptional regulator